MSTIIMLHDPVTLAHAIVGTEIGAIKLTWEEALALAHVIITNLQAQKGRPSS